LALQDLMREVRAGQIVGAGIGTASMVAGCKADIILNFKV
jgi:hypothetical protein